MKKNLILFQPDSCIEEGMKPNMKIGIDLGGSHIGIGLVDDNGNILEKEEKFITEKINIQKQIEQFIIEKVSQIMIKHNVEFVGIAVPGTVSENKMLRSVNLGIENYDLVNILQKKINVKIRLKNDAKCAALAEYKYGELKDYENSVFLCIGTGIGGAVIFNKQLLEAKNVPRI